MKKDILVKLAIILMAWATMADNVITPIAMNVVESYPNITNFQLNFILSGSMLIGIPCAIIFGKLAQVVGKKKLLIFGYGVYIIAGLIPAFSDSLGLLMVCRGAMGIVVGCLGACVFSLIAELYRDERVSGSLIGFYNAFSGLAGVLISTAAGFLARTDWHFAFYSNAVGIICLLMIILFLPNVPPEGKTMENSGIPKEKMPLRVWWYTIGAALFCGLCMPAFYFIAMYVTQAGLGDSATAGILTSMLTIGSFVVGLGFGILFNKLHLYTETFFCFICAAALILLFFAGNAIFAGILIFLVGFGYGAGLSYYYMVATTYAPPSKAAFASGFINAAFNLGCFGCTYIVVFFQSVVKLATYAQVFAACGICLGVYGILATVVAVHYTRMDKLAAKQNAA